MSEGPIFVDMYGTSRRLGLEEPDNSGDDGKHGYEGPHPDGPFWMRGLKGRLPLWVAFWFGFVFGHGIFMAFSVGAILIGTVLGMTMGSGIATESKTMAWLVGLALCQEREAKKMALCRADCCIDVPDCMGRIDMEFDLLIVFLRR